MALTVTVSDVWVGGNKRRSRGTLGFDTSYATGGLSLKAVDLGLTALDQLNIFPKNGYMFEYDYTNAKLKAFLGDTCVLSAGGTSIGSGTSSTTQALLTYTLPANLTLAANMGLKGEFWGTAAANTTAKTVLTTFGSTLLATTGSTVINGNPWYMSVVMTTVSTSAQDAYAEAKFATTWVTSVHSAPVQALTAANTLALQCVTALTTHLVLTGWLITLLGAASTFGAQVEAPASIDLSGVTGVRFEAVGV